MQPGPEKPVPVQRQETDPGAVLMHTPPFWQEGLQTYAEVGAMLGATVEAAAPLPEAATVPGKYYKQGQIG